MSSNQDSIDQAETLRKQMEESPLPSSKLEAEEKENGVSPLPPRSEVHRNKEKQKTKIRLRFPLVRLLTLTFILIVCLVATYNLWKDNLQLTNAKVDEEAKVVDNSNDDSNIDVVEMQDPEKKVQDVKGADTVNQTPLAEDKNKGKQTPEVSQESGTTEPPVAATESTNGTTVNTKSTVTSNQTTKERIVYHRVKTGENLYRISLRYYQSRVGEDIIKRANGLDSEGTVMTGQLLKIPLK
ncbi:LysM peptidoglycan-binding domain-containing protein [Schinkia sp. CFF1]